MIVEDIQDKDRKDKRTVFLVYQGILALLGLVLLLFPARGMTFGALLLGLWLIIDGTASLVDFIRSKASLDGIMERFKLIKSLLWILLGLLFLLRPGAMVRFSVSSIFFIVGLLFVLQALMIWVLGSRENIWGTLLFAVIGALLMLSPFVTALWFLRLLGLLILARSGWILYSKLILKQP